MIGNISFGISFENGRRRVPIPPAVINAVYPSKPFDDPAPPIESIVRSPTRVSRASGEGRGERQGHVFNLGTIRDRCGASSTHEYAGDMRRPFFLCPGGRDAEEPVRRAHDFSEFRSPIVITSENVFLLSPDVSQVL